MTLYVSTGLIHHRGKMRRPGDELDLTEKQAEVLKDFVIKKEVVTAEVDDSNVKELRRLAKEAGIKNYSSKTKAELTVELKALQDVAPVEAVSADEPASD